MPGYLRCGHFLCDRRAVKVVGMEDANNTLNGQTHDCCGSHCRERSALERPSTAFEPRPPGNVYEVPSLEDQLVAQRAQTDDALQLVAELESAQRSILRQWQNDRDLRDQWRARYAELENALSWQTTCLNCSHVITKSYEEYVRRDKLERAVLALADELDGTDGADVAARLRALTEQTEQTEQEQK